MIDSDTHVDEADATWDHLAAHEGRVRPQRGSFDDPRAPGDYWLVDGQRLHKAKRSDQQTKTTAGTRELHDVAARLRHMDELGVDIHVIYPTLFLKGVTSRTESELALTRSYNRWLAERTALSGGRLRWVCVLPFGSPNEAVVEMRISKDNGACGVLKKGDVEAGHPVWHEYFFPMYAEAERLNMPICFHQGSGRITPSDPTGRSPESDFIDMKAPAINGISAILARDVPPKFPDLRFGCLEVGASWVNLVEHMYRRRIASRVRRDGLEPPSSIVNVFEANRIYTTCEVDEDFDTVLRYISEDQLLVGSDYSHNDPSQEHGFIPKLRDLAASGVLTPDGPRKILWDNPKAFYGL